MAADARWYPLDPNMSLQPSLDLATYQHLEIDDMQRGLVVKAGGRIVGILVTANS